MAAQVVTHLTAMRTLQDGTQRTVLRLQPEHLGALSLTVEVHASTVHLAVTGGEAALASLHDGLADLRDQLSQSGLNLGDVSMRQDAADPGRGGREGQPAPQQFDGQPSGDRPRDAAPAPSPPGPSTPAGPHPAGAGPGVVPGPTPTSGPASVLDLRI